MRTIHETQDPDSLDALGDMTAQIEGANRDADAADLEFRYWQVGSSMYVQLQEHGQPLSRVYLINYSQYGALGAQQLFQWMRSLINTKDFDYSPFWHDIDGHPNATIDFTYGDLLITGLRPLDANNPRR